MVSKKRKNKSKKTTRVKITAPVIVGLLMGLLLTVGGIHHSIVSGGIGGYYFAGLGICFMGLVVFLHWGRRG